MTIFYEHPTLGTVEFPNGTPKDVILNSIVEQEAAQGKQYGAFETFGDQAGRSVTSSIRGIKDFTGVEKTPREEFNDQVAEYRSRVQFEQRPAASVLGMLAGGIADPVTLPALALKPLTFASKVATYAARGGAQGLLGGSLEPVYEQYGDSRVAYIMAGGLLGSGLGAGIGKIASKFGAKSPDDVTPDLKDEAKEAVSAVADAAGDVPVRSIAQAQAKIQAEMEIQAKGAPSQQALDDLTKTLDKSKSELGQIDNILNTLKGSTGKATLGSRSNVGRLEARKIEAQKTIQQLEVQKAEGDVLRKAAINLENVKQGRFSKVEGWNNRVQEETGVIPRSKISESVADRSGSTIKGATGFGSLPTGGQRGAGAVLPRPFTDALVKESITPFNPSINRVLGFESATEKAVRLDVGAGLGRQGNMNAAKTRLDTQVAQRMFPRLDATGASVAETAGVVAGKFKGGDPDKIINVKESKAVQEAREEIQVKMARGEELTDADLSKLDMVENSTAALEEYSQMAMKVAGSRGLDTAALRGMMRGRHTFENIDKGAQALLKKNGIEDLEDMVKYILDQEKKDRIFSAEEMQMLSPLFVEVERKLFNAYDLLGSSTGLTDETIALIHSDINLFYGIQAWNKGQGSKVSAALNHRRKMLQDIAENRMIDSLFAGVKCK
tara:strand:+ start:125 stop:2125 length:2001 start_codon:yes stop_codon:yes gene_type:complete